VDQGGIKRHPATKHLIEGTPRLLAPRSGQTRRYPLGVELHDQERPSGHGGSRGHTCTFKGSQQPQGPLDDWPPPTKARFSTPALALAIGAGAQYPDRTLAQARPRRADPVVGPARKVQDGTARSALSGVVSLQWAQVQECSLTLHGRRGLSVHVALATGSTPPTVFATQRFRLRRAPSP